MSNKSSFRNMCIHACIHGRQTYGHQTSCVDWYRAGNHVQYSVAAATASNALVEADSNALEAGQY